MQCKLTVVKHATAGVEWEIVANPDLKGSQEDKSYTVARNQAKAKAKSTVAKAAIRKYPVPVLALSSLIVGSILQWGFGMSVIAGWLWFATLLVGGAPVVWETARNLARKRFASDIVATLAILSAIALNDAFPGLIIVLMQTGGRAIEDYAFRRASSSLEALLERSPRVAHRITNGIVEEVAVEGVRVGETLLVRPGDLIPVDGLVTKGSSMVDEASLTGEPYPKLKSRRDMVYSGTVNLGHAFEMAAERRSSESQYAKIIELVRTAQHDKAPIQRLADKYAVWFTPVTLAVAALGWALTRHPETFLSVLVVATPCSLIFATPVAIISGINRAARQGIVVKHGAAIEQVGKAKVVVFDKTGTITYGTPEVKKIVSFGRYTEDDLLFKAASAEQFSSHPAAQALVAKGIEKFGQGKLSEPSSFKEVPGAGVQCFVDGHNVTIGSKQLLERDAEQYQWPGGGSFVDLNADGGMVAFVAIDHKVEAAITFGDIIRPGVSNMIDDLHSMKINETILLTGDNRANARAVAANAGFDRVESELLPEDKVAYIRALKEKSDGATGAIAMVGDGINDAPALASATVGIAMGARGAAISAEAADIVLLVDDVTKAGEVIKISKRTIRIAMQSIIVGLGTSLLLMGIASTGAIPPTTGALLQEALDVAVILNAVRAR